MTRRGAAKTLHVYIEQHKARARFKAHREALSEILALERKL